MHMVMHHVVGEIAGHEAGRHGPSHREPEDKHDDAECEDEDRPAEQDGHDEPQRIARMIVMHAVNEEVQAFAEVPRDLPMEEISVTEILYQRPGNVAEHHPG